MRFGGDLGSVFEWLADWTGLPCPRPPPQPPLPVCLYLPPNLWSVCVCARACVVVMWDRDVFICVSVSDGGGRRVNLQGPPHTTLLHPNTSPLVTHSHHALSLCPLLCSMLVHEVLLCLPWTRHPPFPLPSPGALSSAGGNTPHPMVLVAPQLSPPRD